MGKLDHQVALVTGASGGLGHAISERLHAEGASLALHYFQSKSVAQTQQQNLGPRSACFQADLRCEQEAQALIQACVAHFGRLDILVNNAGWSRSVPPNDLHALDTALIEQTLQLKIHAPLFCIREAQPYLAEHGQGNIINITSVAGLAAKGSSVIYAAANAALSNLTRSLARVLAPEIRVNAVAPGLVPTGWLWSQSHQAQERVKENNYIQRVIQSEEIAAAVYFLCAEAPGIVGEEIVIDGGIGRLGNKPRSFP